MPELVPVNYDPFAQKQSEPVSAPSFVPVDYDPFEEKSPNFFQRVGKDIDKRSKQASESQAFTRSGQQTKPEEILQLSGAAAGLMGDVVGEAATTIGRGISSVTPESVKTPIKNAANSLMDSSTAKGFGLIAQEGADAWNALEEKSPRAARNLEAVANVGSFFTPVKGTSAATITADAANVGLKGASKMVPFKGWAKTYAKGVLARAPDILDEASDAVRQESSDLFKRAFDAGVIIKPTKNARLSIDIDNAMGRVSERRQGDTLSVVNDLKEKMKNGALGLEELYDYRKDLADIVSDHTEFTGKVKSDGRAASAAMRAIDDFIDGLDAQSISGDVSAIKHLNDAKSQWSKARKMEDIGNIIRSADGDPNRLKAGFKRFVSKKKNLRGFTKEEINLLKQAGSNTLNEKILKGFGKFGFDLGTSLTPGNTFLPAAAGIAAGAGVPNAAPLVGVGTVARSAQKNLARGKAEEAFQAIENRGKTAAAVKPNPPLIRSNPATVPPVAAAMAMKDGEDGEGNFITSGILKRLQGAQDTAFAPVSKPEQNQEPDYNQVLDKIKKAESGGDPNAKNPYSTASGLYQFTNGTWRDMVRKYGDQTGIGMKDKSDPEAQRVMAELLLKDNAEFLTNEFGVEPSLGELYMAHFLGPQGAKKLIKARNNDIKVTSIFPPEYIRANKGIFLQGTRPRTADEVYKILERKVA